LKEKIGYDLSILPLSTFAVMITCLWLLCKCLWITLNGGPCCQMKNIHFLRGWQAAQKGRPADCTTGQASGLPFSAARPSVFCAACWQFTFFIWKHGPPACPALQIVLSSARRFTVVLTIAAFIYDGLCRFRFLTGGDTFFDGSTLKYSFQKFL